MLSKITDIKLTKIVKMCGSETIPFSPTHGGSQAIPKVSGALISKGEEGLHDEYTEQTATLETTEVITNFLH